LATHSYYSYCYYCCYYYCYYCYYSYCYYVLLLLRAPILTPHPTLLRRHMGHPLQQPAEDQLNL